MLATQTRAHSTTRGVLVIHDLRNRSGNSGYRETVLRDDKSAFILRDSLSACPERMFRTMIRQWGDYRVGGRLHVAIYCSNSRARTFPLSRTRLAVSNCFFRMSYKARGRRKGICRPSYVFDR